MKNKLSLLLYIALFITNISFAATDQLDVSEDINEELRLANELMSQKRYQQAYQETLKFSDNNQLAQFYLGIMELYGWGREANHIAACEWFEKSALKDIPMAQELLADCYRDGSHKPANFELAKQWYLRAVANGLPTASFKLGKVYIEGILVEKNQRKGIRLCEEAGNNKSIEAQLFLAKQFDQGGDFKPDLIRALHWYHAAASANSAEAQYRLASILFSGEAGIKDHNQSIKSAEAAAINGFQPAYLLTAKLYLNAPLDQQTKLPTSTNLAKAYMWTQATLRQENKAKEKIVAEEMLKKIRSVMPETWEGDLNGEVDDHFERLSHANLSLQ